MCALAPLLPLLLLPLLLAATVSSSSPPAKTLFGGWFLGDLDGPINGTLPAFIVPDTNYLVLSFVDPTNLTLPESLINLSHVFSADKRHTVLVSIGGESFANKWDWLASADSAKAMAPKVAAWSKYPIDGIDIDAEDSALNYPPRNMALFLSEVKRLVPNFIITLCVYGNPEGRNFDNYLINNHLNGNKTRLFDWIHIMAYNGYDNDVTYVENYTKAPRSKWDHPIDKAVANASVVVAMKGTKGFASPDCSPPDYASMVDYVQTSGLRGVGIWAFINADGNVTLPWFDPNCTAGYDYLCSSLLEDSSTCGKSGPVLLPGL